MSHVLLVQGNALHLPLKDGSVQACITSPPYWNLRDYGTATWIGGDAACTHPVRTATTQAKQRRSSTLEGGKSTVGHQQEGYPTTCKRCGAERYDHQLGLETLHDCNGAFTGQSCGDCYICHMRAVFSEVWRVLRPDGTLWLNCSDSYNAAGRAGHGTRIGYKQGTNRASATGADMCRPTAPGLKEKDLCGIPQRLALALQADGFYWRSEIIYAKKNPMPESCNDRPTRSHEQVFLFSKAPRYFIDMEAIREPQEGDGRKCGPHLTGKILTMNEAEVRANTRWYGTKSYDVTPDGHRNARTVWFFSSEGFAGAHFATFPQALVSRCILAGTPQAGCCASCGTPYQRQVERDYELLGRHRDTGDTLACAHGPDGRAGDRKRSVNTTTGFAPACSCTPAVRTPSIVLDPFGGSGTTALTARTLGRHGVSVDLSWPYLQLSRDRLRLTALDRWHGKPTPGPVETFHDLPMFAREED